MIKKLTRPAFLSLSSVLAISAMALLIAVFLVVSGIDLLQQGLNDSEYSETLVGADACAEEALLRLNSDSGYSGELFTIGQVNCTVSVSGAGSSRTLSLTVSQGSKYVSDLELTVDLSGTPIEVTNWELNP